LKPAPAGRLRRFGSSITSTASHAAWSTPVRPDGIAVAHPTNLKNTAWRSVIIQPGSTVLTRIPASPISRDRVRVRPTVAAFALEYALISRERRMKLGELNLWRPRRLGTFPRKPVPAPCSRAAFKGHWFSFLPPVAPRHRRP